MCSSEQLECAARRPEATGRADCCRPAVWAGRNAHSADADCQNCRYGLQLVWEGSIGLRAEAIGYRRRFSPRAEHCYCIVQERPVKVVRVIASDIIKGHLILAVFACYVKITVYSRFRPLSVLTVKIEPAIRTSVARRADFGDFRDFGDFKRKDPPVAGPPIRVSGSGGAWRLYARL